MKCARTRCKRPAVRGAGHKLCGFHAHVAGAENPRVDAGPARHWAQTLANDGWTVHLIAAQAGVSRDTVKHLISGRFKQVRESTERAILSVSKQDHTKGWVAAWPYTRRVQSLQAAGWSQKDLEKMLGIDQTTISALSLGRKQFVSPQVAEAITEWWDALAHRPVGEPTFTARRRNWPVPMAWRDIDDPDDRPGVDYCRACGREDKKYTRGMCERCYCRLYRAEKERAAR